MTGFGRALAEVGDRRLRVEIRSVNHRGLDVKIRSAEPDAYSDSEIGRAVRAAVERGAVTVQIRVDAASASGRVFNIGCGQATDLNQVVALIGDILGRKIEPSHEPERAGDIKHSYADISAARRGLGYTAAVSFAEGLRRTLDWYRSQHA